MGKIYEGETKLSVIQVCDKLRNEITSDQARVISSHIPTYYGENSTIKFSAKSAFAHAVLGAYKDMPSATEHDMMVKKFAKHLMEKFMKSSATVENEDSAFRLLIDDIMKKGNE